MTTFEENKIALEEDLPAWFPRNDEVKRLLEGAATASSTLEKEIEEVKKGLILQEAQTKAEIEQIASPTRIKYKDSYSINEYRNRILKEFQKLSRNSSSKEIVELFSQLLNVDKELVKISNLENEPKLEIRAPLASIEEQFGSENLISEILLNSTAASYGLEVFGVGSLRYISESEYESETYDSSEGYATLDQDGNVTSGGTYSGYYLK